MDPNRSATEAEEKAIRLRIKALEQAQQQQVEVAEHQLAVAERQMDELSSQVKEAEEELSRLKEKLEVARVNEENAREFYDLSRQPLTDDPNFCALLGLIHPIRRATDDVLRNIFAETVALVAEDPAIQPTQVQPYILSLVCRRWRSIALEAPELWRHIRVDLGDLDTIIREYEHIPMFIYYCDYLELSAERSRHRGIDLVIQRLQSTDNVEPSNALGHSIRRMLVSSGVRKLTVYLAQGVPTIEDGLGEQPSVLALEELQICYTLPTDFQWLPPACVPNLKTLRLPYVYFDYLEPPTRYDAVTEVDVEQPLHYRGLQILSPRQLFVLLIGAFPNAQRVTVDFGYATFLDLFPQAAQLLRLEHAAMRELRIRSPSGFRHFGESYYFPNLTDVTLEFHQPMMGFGDKPAGRTLCHLMQHAFRNVRRLELLAKISLTADVCASLDGMPSLERFAAPYSTCEPAFFERLGAPAWLCPELHSLVVGNSSSDPGTRDAVAKLVVARKAGFERHELGARITTLQLAPDEGPPSQLVSPICLHDPATYSTYRQS